GSGEPADRAWHPGAELQHLDAARLLLDEQRPGAGGAQHLHAVHLGVPAAQVRTRGVGFEVMTQEGAQRPPPTYRWTGTRMMRRFVKTVSAVLAGCAALISLGAEASAQEIQLTGPLAGAPAVRQL